MSSRPAPWLWVGVGTAVAGALVVGVSVGAVTIAPHLALARALDWVPGVSATSLGTSEMAIIDHLRLPRVVLGALVGFTLALCGCAYQGVFRNPLADPYLLGAASGAGLGATLAIGWGIGTGAAAAAPWSAVPLFAFAGALAAVAVTYAVGATGDRRRSPASLLLAGVAVASMATAAQTFFQQRYAETIREVYAWILGRLSTSGWTEVRMMLPYAAVATAVILANRRTLDVLSVGEDEAATLGLNVARSRLIIVAAASLGTAAAVAVSGLIGFVGIIVPHALRLAGVSSYRWLLGLSALAGGGFLVIADVLARQLLSPAEIPIGVVTALIGAPFFVLLLRSRRPAPVV